MNQTIRITDYATCAGCAGKLAAGELACIVQKLPRSTDPRLLVGTETADDAGVFQLTDDLALVQTIDFFPPVVDDPYLFGQIAAANALSDVYAMGGTPITALNLAGFPEKDLPLSILGTIIEGSASKCAEAGCTVLGGHTIKDNEIKFGLAVTGTVHPKKVWTNAGAQPGDLLLLLKPLGTGFVTTAARKQQCPPATLEAAIHTMTTLNKISADICHQFTRVHAVTDITGFGLAGHCYELAAGSKVTCELQLTKLPLLPGVLDLVKQQFYTKARRSNRSFVEPHTQYQEKLDADLLELLYDAQTSGGLLVSVAAEQAGALQQAARTAGCLASEVIGQVHAKQDTLLTIAM